MECLANHFSLCFYAFEDYMKHENATAEYMSFNSDYNKTEGMYTYLFRGVFRCNLTLNGLNSMDQSMLTTDLNRLKGEVRFMRALYYFYLTMMFNNPPLIDQVLTDYTYKSTNANRGDLWSFITNDLYFAKDALPNRKGYSSDDAGRATSGAAMSLLGKIYLYNEQWDSAKYWLGKVIDSDQYELIKPRGTDSSDYVSAYACNFSFKSLTGASGTYEAENNAESVFEVQYANITSNRWNQWIPGYGNNGSLLSSYFAPHGYRNVVPTKKFGELFEDAPLDHPSGLKRDPRMYATLWQTGEPVDLEGVYFKQPSDPTKPDPRYFILSVHTNGGIQEGYGLKKYFFPLNNSDIAPWDDPNNWRIIRYSDVLLMYAEADYRINNASTSDGLEKLNLVRERVGMPALNTLTPQAIMFERSVEFGGECLRFHDLVRWSITQNGEPWINDITSYLPFFIVGKHEFLPFPTTEITKNSPLLIQNPGY